MHEPMCEQKERERESSTGCHRRAHALHRLQASLGVYVQEQNRED